jgi:hypothetical protein
MSLASSIKFIYYTVYTANPEDPELRYQERNREARMKYYRYLRELIKVYVSQSRVFIDESGFEEFQDCAFGGS